MSDQSEALRLAEWLDHHGEKASHADAAAELRRLHAANMDCLAWYEAIKSERDALLEALRPFAETDLTSLTVRDTFGFDVLRARAAIAKCEGAKE